MTTRYLKLPFSFDQDRLQEDVHTILKNDWIPHFNQQGYTGKWNSIALYAKDGNHKNIIAHHVAGTEILPTELLKDCVYLPEVIEHFKCEFLAVRLLNLGAGAFIKPHKDHESGYEDDLFRLHIPICTNKNVEFILDGDMLNMNPGECWYTNVNYEHSVANRGSEDRIHLVIDGQRNDWSDKLFFSLAPKESYFPEKKEEYDEETLKQMIKELSLNDSIAANDLIVTLKNKLAIKVNK